MIGIYKITNKINNKAYIGQSIDIENRWRQHKLCSFIETKTEYNSPIHQAIRKYGLENFSFEVLEECEPEQLNEREIYWIDYYQTFPVSSGKGYNQTIGGDNYYVGRLYKEDIANIVNLLQHSDLTITQIAAKVGIDQPTISNINNGKVYSLPNIKYPIRNTRKKINHCIDCGKVIRLSSIRCRACELKLRKPLPKPPYEILLKDFYEMKNRSLVAQKYNVSENLVRKWCKSYGFRCQDKKAYIEKYEVEFLGKEPKIKHPRKKVAQINPETKETIKIWNTRTEIANFYNVSSNCISDKIKDHKLFQGYLFEFVED